MKKLKEIQEKDIPAIDDEFIMSPIKN